MSYKSLRQIDSIDRQAEDFRTEVFFPIEFLSLLFRTVGVNMDRFAMEGVCQGDCFLGAEGSSKLLFMFGFNQDWC